MITRETLKTLTDDTPVWFGKVRFSWWTHKISGVTIKEVRIKPKRWWWSVIKLYSPKDGKMLGYNGHLGIDLYETVEEAIEGVNKELQEIEAVFQSYVNFLPDLEELKIK